MRRRGDVHAAGLVVLSLLGACRLRDEAEPLPFDHNQQRAVNVIDDRLVSVSTTGEQANSNTTHPSMSADGRYVAFVSDATNLVPGVTGQHVYVHDRTAHTTDLVDVSGINGAPSDGAGFHPSISADGRFVAFDSMGKNLDPLDTTTDLDVYVRDLVDHKTELVSIQPDNKTKFPGASMRPSINNDGRFVAFVSVTGLTNVYVRDRGELDVSPSTTLVTLSPTGDPASGGHSYRPSISADGNLVAFYSDATNLVAGDTNDMTDVFVRDVGAQKTERVSVSSGGAQGNASSWVDADAESRILSADGRYVVFQSQATNLVPGDINGWVDVFLRDRVAGSTTLISQSTAGVQGNSSSTNPTISRDGRHVAFASYASNLFAATSPRSPHIFVRDRDNSTTSIRSISSEGTPANSTCDHASINGDSSLVAFESLSDNLVPGDQSGFIKIFVLPGRAGATPPTASFTVPTQETGPGRPTTFVHDAADPDPGDSIARWAWDFGDGTFSALEYPVHLYAAPGTYPVQLTVRDNTGLSATTTRNVVIGAIPPPSHLDVFASVNSDAIQGDGDSSFASISGDGRLVAFSSLATNFVPAFPQGEVPRIALHDRLSGATTLRSVSYWGAARYVDDFAVGPAISRDGKHVAFLSQYNAIAPVDGNVGVSVFVHDLEREESELIDVDENGLHPGQGPEGNGPPAISANGNVVAFASAGLDLLYPGIRGVFVRDRAAGTTRLVSLPAGPEPVPFSHNYSQVSISADGNYVAFCTAANLAGGDENGFVDLYLRDRKDGNTERISIAEDGGDADSASCSDDSPGYRGETRIISDDGRYVVFESRASNLVSPRTFLGTYGVFVRDRQERKTTVVSVDKEGNPIDSDARHPTISGNGRYVAFRLNDRLEPGDVVGGIYIRDMQTGETKLASRSCSGMPVAGDNPSLSDDGRHLAFDTRASLTAADNLEFNDVYVVPGIGGNRPPVAAFSFTPGEADEGSEVSFVDSSSDPDSCDEVVSWAWNFGDGASSTNRHPSHAFAQGGSYDVTLTVRDVGGAGASTTKRVEVRGAPVANPPPAAAPPPAQVSPSGGIVRGGCASSDPAGGSAAALLLFLVALRRSRRLLLASLLVLPLASRAETPQVDVSFFRPASGGDGLAGVEGARPPLARDRFPDVKLWVTDAVQPLAYFPDSGGRQVLVKNRASSWLTGQVYLLGPLSLAAQVPLLLAQNGDLSLLPAPATGSSSFSAGLGDLRVTPRLALLRQEGAGIDVAGQLSLDLPTASGGSLLGDGRVLGEVLGAVGRRMYVGSSSSIDLLGNVYLRLRPPRQIVDVKTGNQLGLRAAVAWLPPFAGAAAPRRLYAELEGESFLRARFAGGSVPVEWRAGARFCLGTALQLDAAAGSAIANGIGAARGRFVLGIGYSPSGCAQADRDGDGIADVKDRCPTVPGLPAHQGCPPPVAVAEVRPEPPPERAIAPRPPPDRDGDGVPDEQDSCPDRPGPASNFGCPEDQKQMVAIKGSRLDILDKIHFEFNKAVIQPRSFPLLDQVAALISSHLEMKRVRIEGHTDIIGSDAYNLTLSRARAQAVKAYLEEKGVPAARLDAEGFGRSRPIAPNATSEGRAMNRRVEFNVEREPPPVPDS